MKFNQSAYDMISPMPLFSREMRKANRHGLKTQTRRIVKLPKWSTGNWEDFELDESEVSVFNLGQDQYTTPLVIAQATGCLAEIRCPHGYPNDLRYMREPLFCGGDGYAYYADDDGTRDILVGTETMKAYVPAQRVKHLLTGENIKWTWKPGVLSSIYMPKYAARTFKRYREVRVERLNSISADDCIAEGIDGEVATALDKGMWEAVLAWRYAELWNSLNAKRGYPWASDPLVWVIGYEVDESIGY